MPELVGNCHHYKNKLRRWGAAIDALVCRAAKVKTSFEQDAKADIASLRAVEESVAHRLGVEVRSSHLRWNAIKSYVGASFHALFPVKVKTLKMRVIGPLEEPPK